MSADLAVVGGGPAGLTTALAAARRGRSVVLYESASRLGGMAASIEVAGQRVDLGSHRLHPSASAPVAALLDEVLGDDLQTRERNGRLHIGGSWVRFPFRPTDLVRSTPPRVAGRLVADLLRRSAPDPDASTYADVVRSGLGPTALREFHGPMAAKLWGRPADELSAELARRRVSVRDRRAVARRLARTSRPAGRTFRYPRLGYGQIVDRLTETAAAAGVEIRLGSRLDPTAHDHGHVAWTAPVADLAAALGRTDALPEHRGVVLVYLVVPAEQWTPFDAHYVPDPDVSFARLSEPKNYRDGPDPGAVTVLCAEVPATVGDPTWRTDDGALAGLVLDGIERLGLPVPEIVGTHTVRLPRVYPVLTAEDADARADVLSWAAALEGITVLGRQGLVVADNLHHVLDMALTFASLLGPTGPDPAAWAAARDRFDRFVVDD